MSTELPLAGRTIVVTRPRAQADALAALIAGQGGRAVVFPVLEIGPADDPAPLDRAIASLDSYALAIFISPNAVEFSVPVILSRRSWPTGLQAAAVGQSSVATLAGYGIHGAMAPSERFDSEALLELPEFQEDRVRGRRVLILRGNGGRELLADTLRARGAEVDHVTCYHRSPPVGGAGPLTALWDADRLDALTISSSEGLRNLVELLDGQRARLCETPTFVPHQRIAEIAGELGLKRVILTGPADAGIIAGLCAYNWQ